MVFSADPGCDKVIFEKANQMSVREESSLKLRLLRGARAVERKETN